MSQAIVKDLQMSYSKYPISDSVYHIFKPLFTIIPNHKQQDAKFLGLFISTDALRVSGCSSAHH